MVIRIMTKLQERVGVGSTQSAQMEYMTSSWNTHEDMMPSPESLPPHEDLDPTPNEWDLFTLLFIEKSVPWWCNQST